MQQQQHRRCSWLMSWTVVGTGEGSKQQVAITSSKVNSSLKILRLSFTSEGMRCWWQVGETVALRMENFIAR